MKQVISKYIAQVRYTPTLAFYDQMFNIAASLESSEEFGNWKATRSPDSAFLFNRENRTGLNVDGNSVTIKSERDDIGNRIVGELARYSTLFLDTTNVVEFDHVGIRKISIFEMEHKYSDYIEKFYDAFYKDKDQVKETLVDTIEDTLYILEGIKDGFHLRIKFAPLKKDQFRLFYDRDEFTPKDFELKKETNFFIDVDIFSNTEKDYTQSIEELEKIYELHKTTFSAIVKEVKEKTE